MKRLVLAVVAASFLAAPMVEAQAAPMVVPAVSANAGVVHVDWKKTSRHDERRYDDRHYDNRRHVDRRKIVKKKVVERRSHWKRGQHYSDWRRHRAVRDYRSHGLKRPGHGQQWIKVDNNYMLVGIASGLIGAMIAGR